jgi:hypothetical protein
VRQAGPTKVSHILTHLQKLGENITKQKNKGHESKKGAVGEVEGKGKRERL